MSEDRIYFEKNKKALFDIISMAYKKVPFYRNFWQLDIPCFQKFTYEFYQNIPLLEKKYIRENSERFINEDFSSSELYSETTSGTEGNPIICYRSKNEQLLYAASQWKNRRTFIPDLSPKDRFAHFYVFRKREGSLVSNEILLNESELLLPIYELTEEKLVEIWHSILLFKPRWMHGTPSCIYNLALVAKKYDLPRVHIELVEIGGEFVKTEYKKVISEVFNGFIVEQYGARECWPIAYSDKKGRLKLSDNVYVDTVYDEKHKKTNLVITPLKNYSWPLIKYNIGDEGHIYYENDNAYVRLSAGRTAVYFKFNNRVYNTILFSGLARNLCAKYNHNVIEQFQIQKISETKLNIDLKMSNIPNKCTILNEYMFEIRKIFGLEVEITVVEKELIEPDCKTGKYKEFVDLSNKL